MVNPIFYTFDDKDALAEALANKVAVALRDAVASDDRATLVVSGGSTPVPFFKALAAYPMEWDKLTVLLADERWVSVDDADSNERLVKEHLLQDGTTLLSLAPLEDETLENGAKRLDQALKDLGAPSVTILGMGEDAHTASLFPNHPALEEGLNKDSGVMCLAVTDSPKPPPERVSLGANLLCRSGLLILHITGEGKKAAYENAMESDDLKAHPIAAILKQSESEPEVYWSA